MKLGFREAGNSTVFAMLLIGLGAGTTIATQSIRSNQYNQSIHREIVLAKAEQLNLNAITLLADAKPSALTANRIAADVNAFTASSHNRFVLNQGDLLFTQRLNLMSSQAVSQQMAATSTTFNNNSVTTRLGLVRQYDLAGTSFWEVEARTRFAYASGKFIQKATKARIPLTITTVPNPSNPTASAGNTGNPQANNNMQNQSNNCNGPMTPGNSSPSSNDGNASANANAQGNNTSTGTHASNTNGMATSGSCASASSN
ncbi:MAG: hypothetical protein HRU19_22215 [Pseudobacteriovorax sp.]|nr:hypothetical protein [Pseudobacteriovorax sp.]